MASDTLEALADVLVAALLVYALFYYAFQLFLIAVAASVAVREVRRPTAAVANKTYANRFLPPVSVIVPAHNEEAGVVASVRAMLALRYPYLEVVVVDDGSTDGTFDSLRREFDLVESPWVPRTDIPLRGALLSVHCPRGDEPVVVVRKEASGAKADALNAGITVASSPLVCCVDADSLLAEDALLAAVRPFLYDPQRTVASGGVIRVANDCAVDRGRVTRIVMPRRLLTRVQVVEYVRAFTVSRLGMERLGILIILSGAFSLLRRDAVVAAGGMRVDTVAEDAEIVLRLHRLCRRVEQPYRVAMVGDAVCWTEVPSTTRMLRRQRIRWAQGLCQLLWSARGMTLHPRYGRIGLVAMPFYWAFELLSPFVVGLGLAALAYGWWVGLVGWEFVLLFLGLLLGLSWLASMASIAVDEIAWSPYTTQRQLLSQATAGLVAGVGLVQLMSWWRLRGLVRAVLRREGWGQQARTGFADAEHATAGGGAHDGGGGA